MKPPPPPTTVGRLLGGFSPSHRHKLAPWMMVATISALSATRLTGGRR